MAYTMRVAFIDHYDSFSKNIVSWLESAQCEVDHFYFDAIPTYLMEKCSVPLVFSPGPGSPSDYPFSLNLMKKNLGNVPILGVCLGHQMLGTLAGFEMRRSHMVWHGHARDISVTRSTGLFKSMSAKLNVASYNSLCLEANPKHELCAWEISAINLAGEIEAIENWQVPSCPAFGIQFHPESFLSQDLSGLLHNWTDVVKEFRGGQ